MDENRKAEIDGMLQEARNLTTRLVDLARRAQDLFLELGGEDGDRPVSILLPLTVLSSAALSDRSTSRTT